MRGGWDTNLTLVLVVSFLHLCVYMYYPYMPTIHKSAPYLMQLHFTISSLKYKINLKAVVCFHTVVVGNDYVCIN